MSSVSWASVSAIPAKGDCYAKLKKHSTLLTVSAWCPNFDTTKAAATVSPELCFKGGAENKGFGLQVRHVLVMDFVIVLLDMLGISDPHAAENTVLSQFLACIGGAELHLPVMQGSMKSRA